MKVVAIHQPQYLPYLGFFHKVLHADVFVILDNVQFQKNGHQNRNRIKTNQGWQWLTVPILHRFGQLIREVEIDPKLRWGRKHWNALTANYARSRHLDKYGPELKEILGQEWKNLCQLNLALIQWAMKALGITTPLVYSSDLDASGSRTELLVDICRIIGADCYLSGPGGRRYMDLAAFQTAGIAIAWQQFLSPVYEQVFPQAGFIPDLSVADALFCCGSDTIKFLQAEDGRPGFIVGSVPEQELGESVGIEEVL